MSKFFTPKYQLFHAALLVTALFLSASYLVHAQTTPSIQVIGAIPRPLTLSAADLAAMPRATVTTTSDGIQTVYEGVWFHDVLVKAGARSGEALRGAALAGYVLTTSSDGYQVLFSIAELDPAITDQQFLLADKANGKPLFGANGAFRLVIPKDKRGARSVRLLEKIEIVQLRK